MPEGEGQTSGQVSDQGADGQDPSLSGQPDHGAEGDGEQGQRDAARQPQQRMVPLAEHIKLRKQAQAVKSELEKLRAQLTAKSDEGTSEEEVARSKWKKFLGLDRIEKMIENLTEKASKISELEERTGKAEHGSDLAFNAYTEQLEHYARAQYDPKTMPIPMATWEAIVSAQMTPQECVRIVQGDTRTYQAVVERAKKLFAPKADINKAREAEALRRLPKAPGPGGNPPAAPAPEKVTGRALHAKAADLAFEAMARER